MKFVTITLSVFLLAITSTTLAGTNHHHNMQQSDMHAAAPMAQGVVNKINLQRKQINLTHGPIKALGWPSMTMDFTVKDATILQGISAGQKVVFDVVKGSQGQYFVTRIAPQK